MKRLFKQLEQQENGTLNFKKGTHYNSQEYTHIHKGELKIPFQGGQYDLRFISLERDKAIGYKHHLHSYVNHCNFPSLFIIAPRKPLARMVKPKAPDNYRLLCHNMLINEFLDQNEHLHQLYSVAENGKLAPWIQGRIEQDRYCIKVQYSSEASNAPFFTSVFDTLKYLTQEFNRISP